MNAPPPAVLAAIIAGAQPPPDPETHLATLGRDLLAAWAAQVRGDLADAGDLSEEAGDRADAAYDRVSAIVDAIETLPAAGLPGLAVKALAACWCVSADLSPDVAKEDYGGTDMVLLAQLRRGVLALDGAEQGEGVGSPGPELAALVTRYEATWRVMRAEGRRLEDGGAPEENAAYVEACADCARQRATVALHPAASLADALLKVRVFVAGISIEEDAADLAREIGWRGGQAYDDDVAHAVVLDLARLAPSFTGSRVVS